MEDRTFGHIRAYLLALSQDYSLKPPEGGYEKTATNISADGNSVVEAFQSETKVDKDMVRQVVSLLEDEDEDGLKELLRQRYTLDEKVSFASLQRCNVLMPCILIGTGYG
jgi:hypothetical protein